jgi:uncharacterized protein YdbL (DUF1318 family)
MRKLLLLVALLAAPSVAQTPAVNGARASGAVGERYDGYMGVAAPVSGALRSQVATINIKRRSLYSNLAASKGVSPQDVGVTAGSFAEGEYDISLPVTAALIEALKPQYRSSFEVHRQ